MKRRNFRIVTFSLLFAGLGLMIASVYAAGETVKTILLGGTALCYLAAGIQIAIYKSKRNGN